MRAHVRHLAVALILALILIALATVAARVFG